MRITKKLSTMAVSLMLTLLVSGIAMASSSTTNTTAEQTKNEISSQVAAAAATANIGMINNRITAMTGNTGLSSGGAMGMGAWALGGYNYLDSSKSGGKYDGTLANFMVGMDKQFGSLLVGVSFGFETLDLTTKYNSGKMEYDGWSVVPYLSYSFSKDLVADASFGYTWLDYTMKDTQGATSYSDDMSANRMVTSLGLTKYMSFDKLLLSGRVGTLYLHEHQGSYKLNNTNYGQSGIYTWQGSLAVRGTYDFGQFKPFLGATYMQDFLKSGGKEDDMWGADFDLGVNYAPAANWTVGLTGIYGIREDLTKVGGLLNVRYEF